MPSTKIKNNTSQLLYLLPYTLHPVYFFENIISIKIQFIQRVE